MLLRRVMQHVSGQNWFAVAIDFLIVVVGVYVGIEVSNWNADRQANERAAGYLERIAADLESDRESLAGRMAFWGDVEAYGVSAIRFAESGTLTQDSAWKTVLAFYQSSQIWPYYAVDTTYTELRSAGELGLIADTELRQQFAEYYVTGPGLQANYLLRLVPEYRELVRGMTPWDVSRYIWEHCHINEGVFVQRLIDCEPPPAYSEDEALSLANRFRADAGLVDALRFWITNVAVGQGILDQNLAAAESLTEIVRAELDAL